MQIQDFKNKHYNQVCVVCGLGSSLRDINPRIPKKYITFGVNELHEVFTPNYLVVSESIDVNKYPDNPEYTEKLQSILDTTAGHVFTQHPEDKYTTSIIIHTEMESVFKGRRISEILLDDKIPAYRKCPTAAIGLAFYMGFKRIGVIGVDMQGPRVINDLVESLNCSDARLTLFNDQMSRFNEYAHNNGIEIYNLSDKSAVTAFPQITQAKFMRL